MYSKTVFLGNPWFLGMIVKNRNIYIPKLGNKSIFFA